MHVVHLAHARKPNIVLSSVPPCLDLQIWLSTTWAVTNQVEILFKINPSDSSKLMSQAQPFTSFSINIEYQKSNQYQPQNPMTSNVFFSQAFG